MRLINVDELLSADKIWEVPNCGEFIKVISVEDIYNAPTIKVKPTKHGHWVHPSQNCDYRSRDIFSDCSVCGDIQIENTPYCPNCGAQMDE